MQKQFSLPFVLLALVAIVYVLRDVDSGGVSSGGISERGPSERDESGVETAGNGVEEIVGRSAVAPTTNPDRKSIGIVVSDLGDPLTAKLRVAESQGGAVEGEEDSIVAHSDANGRFSMTIPLGWRHITVTAESTDGLWFGAFDRALDGGGDESGHLCDLGEFQLDFLPAVHIRLLIDDNVVHSLSVAGIERLIAQPSRPRSRLSPFAAGPFESLSAGSRTLQEFRADQCEQSAIVRVPSSYVESTGSATISLRNGETRIDERQLNLLIEAERHITFEIGPEMILSGSVEIDGHPADDAVLHFMVRTANIADIAMGTVRTDPDGTFVTLVKPKSRGTIWPSLHGQSEESEWYAGHPVSVEIKTSGVLRVRLLDDLGKPIPRGLVSQGPTSEWGLGVETTQASYRLTNGTYFLARERISAGTPLFVRVPGSAERMFVTAKDYSSETGDVTIRLDETSLAASSLRVEVRGSYARQAGRLRVRLERVETSKETIPIKYYCHLNEFQRRYEGLFEGVYGYRVHDQSGVIQSGQIVLSDGSCASLFIDV